MIKSFILLVFLSLICSCRENITIIYDNDVHCSVNGYPVLAGIRDSIQGNSLTVSCGDFLSGNSYGTASRGEYIIKLMNSVGYDCVTIGNHEFDYSVPKLIELTDSLKTSVVCCNFRKLGAKNSIFDDYAIKEIGGWKIAFIGVVTPSSPITSNPKFFKDSTGTSLYDFCGFKIDSLVQKTVNEVHDKGADYVVVLSHLGDKNDTRFITSRRLIESTFGIDAVLDGHDHHVIECDTVYNIKGQPVVLSSTGAFMKNIGILNLSKNGETKTSLIPVKSSKQIQSNVYTCLKEIKTDYKDKSEDYKIGKCRVVCTTYDKKGKFIGRQTETNIGDLMSDAFRTVLGADIGLINSGGIRDIIPPGIVTYNTLIKVNPFEDYVHRVKVKGIDILNALETGSCKLPMAYGGFLQVSGLKYEIDTRIPSPVIFDSNGVFLKIKGKRRVRNVMVMDKETRKYFGLDTNKFYSIAGSDYLIDQKGDGIVLNPVQEIQKNNMVLSDIRVIETYIKDTLLGIIGNEYLKPDNRIKIIR